jgi:HNH endonuclease
MNKKEIPEFPGYQVDTDGNVWSAKQNKLEERRLKPGKSSNGYLIVRLAKDLKYHTKLIHILVCEAFRGPRPSLKHEVRHLDGNTDNVALTNLVWGTASENQLDRRKHGTSPQGENHPRVILTDDNVRDIRDLLSKGIKCVDIAEEFSVSRYCISDIKRGKNWLHIK